MSVMGSRDAVRSREDSNLHDNVSTQPDRQAGRGTDTYTQTVSKLLSSWTLL